MPQDDVYIGLGSNLNEPVMQVCAAMRELDQLPGVSLQAASSLYRSPPMGGMAQPDYINAAVRVATTLAPERMLQEMQALERQHGREEAHTHWAARTLDLDLLLWGQESRREATLILPHPGLHERAFVLAPLCELDPALQVPGFGAAVELLQQCKYAQVDRVGACPQA